MWWAQSVMNHDELIIRFSFSYLLFLVGLKGGKQGWNWFRTWASGYLLPASFILVAILASPTLSNKYLNLKC